jgi:hypothetical protein
MSYKPEIPRNRYDNYGDREWTRLERDAQGELLYHVHLDILKRYINPSDCVFEIRARVSGSASAIACIWKSRT